MALRTARSDTADLMVDIAQRLIQTRGYSRFSYADVATELGVTKATLHYHFAGKADLGQAVLDRYVARFYEAIEAIDAAGSDGLGGFEAYVDLYRQVVRGERMCLCGMLAAEIELLPPAMRVVVSDFFDRNVEWLDHLLARGADDGSLFPLSAPERAARAQSVLALLQGGMLSARATSAPARFEMVVDQLRLDLGRQA
jgi:TetR/AcrR family transcriptional repressor of nem operon